MDIRLDPPKAALQIRRDGRALIETAAELEPATPVPSAPGWTVRDLLAHTGEVYAHKTAVLRNRLHDRPVDWAQAPAEGDLAPWLSGQLDELLAALRATPPETPVWTWFPAEQRASFWFRRMAQETVVHRADAELAAGQEPHHVDAVVAVDGIDEFLERFVVFGTPPQMTGGWPELAVLTAGATWRVSGAADGLRVERDVPPAGELVVAGTPSHVLYWLWGRLGDDAVDVRGARDSLNRVRQVFTAASQ